MYRNRIGIGFGVGLALAALSQTTAAAEAPAALVSFQTLSPELAQELVTKTVEACRKAGYQVAVAVVDRAGVPQAMLRDRLAGPHTPDTAIRKAWTAVSFKSDTQALAETTQSGKPQSGARGIDRVLMLGGGVPIEAEGSLVGAVGVSGAPGGEEDAACAREGLAAIEDRLTF